MIKSTEVSGLNHSATGAEYDGLVAKCRTPNRVVLGLKTSPPKLCP